MSRIGRLWNTLANPKNIPKLFSIVLALVLLIGFLIPLDLNVEQLYPRPAPQEQVLEGIATAPYARGGEVLEIPGITRAQYPENSKSIGWINSYMSPIAIYIQSVSPYFGTSIYSSPGGLIDEILYYTRGFDTILESTILMMSFVIASWLALNFTMNRKKRESNDKNDSTSVYYDPTNKNYLNDNKTKDYKDYDPTNENYLNDESKHKDIDNFNEES